MSTGLHFILAWSLLWIMLLGVCLWAISRGGQAERVGALLILTAALLSAGGDLFAYAHGLREHPSWWVALRLTPFWRSAFSPFPFDMRAFG